MVLWHLMAVRCRNGLSKGQMALQLVIMAWKAWYQERVIECLERRVQDATETGEPRPPSIRKMRKAELVQRTKNGIK